MASSPAFTRVLAVLAPLALTSAALAHVTLETPQGPANSTYKAILRIPHGCDGRATHTVRVQVPEGFIAVKPMPKAGWKIETKEGAYARSYDYLGTPTSRGVKEVVWSGGERLDAHYDEFVLRGRIVDLQPGSVLWLETVQECAEGTARWIEIPTAGQKADDLKHPAPGLEVTATRSSH